MNDLLYKKAIIISYKNTNHTTSLIFFDVKKGDIFNTSKETLLIHDNGLLVVSTSKFVLRKKLTYYTIFNNINKEEWNIYTDNNGFEVFEENTLERYIKSCIECNIEYKETIIFL